MHGNALAVMTFPPNPDYAQNRYQRQRCDQGSKGRIATGNFGYSGNDHTRYQGFQKKLGHQDDSFSGKSSDASP